MKVNDQFRCGEEIYVENESDPTCGSDMVEFPPWDQCVSKPYVYSLFSFKKTKSIYVHLRRHFIAMPFLYALNTHGHYILKVTMLTWM